MKKSANFCKLQNKLVWLAAAWLWLASGSLAAQSADARCQDFDLILSRIKDYYASEDYSRVLVQLQAARACDPAWDGVNGWYERVFLAINQQKEAAVRDREAALRAREKAGSALRKAELLALAQKKAAEEAEYQRQLAVILQQTAEVRSRQALANELAFNAKILLKEGQRDKALALSDFAYHYVDSLNPLVQSVLFDLFYANVALEVSDGLNEEAAMPQQMAVSWAPDGGRLAIAYDNGVLNVLDGGSMTFLATVDIPTCSAPILAWSPDGAWLALGTEYGEVKIWETAEWAQRSGFTLNNIQLMRLAWHPEEELLALADRDGYVHFRQPFTGESSAPPLKVHEDWIRGLTWSPDGALLATCSDDQRLAVIKRDGFAQVARFEAHTDWVRDLAWLSNEQLITVGDDARVVLWRPLRSTVPEREIARLTDWVLRVDLSPDKKLAVTTTNNGVLRIIRISDGAILDSLQISDRFVNDADWQPSGNRIVLASGGTDELAAWVDWEDGALSEWQSMAMSAAPEAQRVQQQQTTYRGDETAILCVAWSSNSRRLASGATDGTIRLFHTQQRGEPSVWNSGQERVEDIAWSADDRYLATSGADHTVKIWEAATGDIKAVFRQERPIRRIAWSPQGKRLAVACDDQLVYVYEVERQRLELRLVGHTDWIRGLAWSPDGSRLVTGSDDRSVRIWNSANGSQLLSAGGHANYVMDVAWSADGRRIASGDEMGRVIVWQADSLVQLSALNLAGTISALSWRRDRNQLYAGVRAGSVAIWAEDAKQEEVLWKDGDSVYDLAPSPDGRLLAIASEGGGPAVLEMGKVTLPTFQQWRSYTPPVTPVVYQLDSILNMSIKGINAAPGSLIYAPDGQKLAYIDANNRAFIRDMQRDKTTELTGHADWVRHLAWSADGSRLVSCSDDGTLKIWSAGTGQQLWSSEPLGEYLYRVSWSEDGKWLATAGAGRFAYLFGVDRMGVFQTPETINLNSAVKTISFAERSQRLLIGHQGEEVLGVIADTLSAWDIAARKWTYHLPVPVTLENCQLSPDGAWLLALNPGDYPLFFRLSDGKEIYTPVSKRWKCAAAAWSPGELSVALATTGKQVEVWDARRWRPLATLDKFDKEVRALAWSPSAQLLATATEDGVTQLWDVSSGQEVLRTVAAAGLSGLMWSPEGANLIAIINGDHAKFWRVDFGLLLGLVRREQQLQPLSEADLARYGLERGLGLNQRALNDLIIRENEPQLVAWARYFATRAQSSIDWNMAQNNLDQALRLYDRADSLSTVNWYYQERARHLVYYGQQWLARGELEQAGRHLKSAFELAPGHPDALLVDGLRQWMVGNRSAALQQIMEAYENNASYELINILLEANANDVTIPDVELLYRFVTYDNPSASILEQMGIAAADQKRRPIEPLIALLPASEQERYRLRRLINEAGAEPAAVQACTLFIEALRGMDVLEPDPIDLRQQCNGLLLRRLQQTNPMSDDYQRFLPVLEELSRQLPAGTDWLSLGRNLYQAMNQLAQAGRFAEAREASRVLDGVIDGLAQAQNDYDYVSIKLNNQVDQAWFSMLLGNVTSGIAQLEPMLVQDLVAAEARLKQAHGWLLQGREDKALETYRALLPNMNEQSRQVMVRDFDWMADKPGVAAVRAQVDDWYTAISEANVLQNEALQSRQSYYDLAGAQNYEMALASLDSALARWERLEGIHCRALAAAQLAPGYCEAVGSQLGTDWGNRSFYLLFVRRFAEAARSAEEGFARLEQHWIRTNEGHAYLYRGQWGKARDIYMAIKDLPDENNEGALLGEALLADFETLRDAGIWHKDVLKAAALVLGRKLTAEERLRYGRLTE